ncbi:MAG: ThuA domain-containing protein [Pirellulaceae bacterium]
MIAINRRDMLLSTGAAVLGISAFPLTSTFGTERKQRKILYFTREGGDYEHGVVRRKGEELSLSERTLVDLGKKIGLHVECTKDGRVFDEDLDQYDGFALYGYDLTRDNPKRTPPVSPAGKHQLLSAIHKGKGFVGFHSAIIGDRHLREQGGFDPLVEMVGGMSLGHGKQQEAIMSITSPKFPGVQDLGESFALHEEWHALTNFADDLHVILSQETQQMKGPRYERPRFPATWARMHGKGRIFYTSMGHRSDVWSHEIFRQIVSGALTWTTGGVDADVTPNIEKVTPGANYSKSS